MDFSHLVVCFCYWGGGFFNAEILWVKAYIMKFLQKSPKWYQATLHWGAFSLLLLTLILLFIGALVTSTDSGLSVPDWPTTYNYNMFTYPVSLWVGGVLYEHGHRLFASLVGFITMVLAILSWVFDSRKSVKFLTLSALVLVSLSGRAKVWPKASRQR